MDIRKVKKLIELVEESTINELEISSGDESIRIVRNQLDNADKVSQVTDATYRVVAPVSGIFYLSPAPDSPAYCHEGQTVNKGDILGAIDALNMMNKIHTEQAGKVNKILVEHGQQVQQGDKLFVIDFD
mgnify:CR=1 FL=1